jgi:hypothetical protein
MSGTYQVIGLLVITTVLCISVVTLPRWFCRSVTRDHLWRLRDRMTDDILERRLPYDHPAVRELSLEMDVVLGEYWVLDFVHYYVWRWAKRGTTPSVRKVFQPGDMSLDGLTAKQRRLVVRHREKLRFLCAATMFVGSWFGLLHVIRFLPSALKREGQKQREKQLEPQLAVRSSLWRATASAVTHTTLGRESTDFVESLVPEQVA